MKKENQDNIQESWEEIRKEISDLTILIATAREEGDEEEHKKVVDRIMELLSQEKEKSFQEGYEKCLKDSSKPLK